MSSSKNEEGQKSDLDPKAWRSESPTIVSSEMGARVRHASTPPSPSSQETYGSEYEQASTDASYPMALSDPYQHAPSQYLYPTQVPYAGQAQWQSYSVPAAPLLYPYQAQAPYPGQPPLVGPQQYYQQPPQPYYPPSAEGSMSSHYGAFQHTVPQWSNSESQWRGLSGDSYGAPLPSQAQQYPINQFGQESVSGIPTEFTQQHASMDVLAGQYGQMSLDLGLTAAEPLGNRVFYIKVESIPLQIDYAQIKETFTLRGVNTGLGDLVYIRILEDRLNPSTKKALISYKTLAAAECAISLYNGTRIWNGVLAVNRLHSREDCSLFTRPKATQPQLLAPANEGHQVGRTASLQVDLIRSDVKEAEIRNHFMPRDNYGIVDPRLGKIIKVGKKYDDEGKFRGRWLVTFNSPEVLKAEYDKWNGAGGVSAGLSYSNGLNWKGRKLLISLPEPDYGKSRDALASQVGLDLPSRNPAAQPDVSLGRSNPTDRRHADQPGIVCCDIYAKGKK